MKRTLFSISAAIALILPCYAADVSVKLSDVHLCCNSCVKGAEKAIGTVQGLTAKIDKDDEAITLTGADTATVQKGVDALVAAGYFGKSSDSAVKVASNTGAEDKKVQSVQLEGVHLCCTQCVRSVNRALEGVEGVKTNTATKNAKSFTVSGDFNEKAVLSAIQKEGLTGKVAK